MSARAVYAMLVVLTLVGAGLFAAARFDWSWASPGIALDHEGMTIVVRAGDTLWSLAATHRPDGVDIRESVDWIQAKNELSGALLRPGQRLIVPAVANNS